VRRLFVKQKAYPALPLNRLTVRVLSRSKLFVRRAVYNDTTDRGARNLRTAKIFKVEFFSFG